MVEKYNFWDENESPRMTHRNQKLYIEAYQMKPV